MSGSPEKSEADKWSDMEAEYTRAATEMTGAPARVLVDVVLADLAARGRGDGEPPFEVLDAATGPGIATLLVLDRASAAGVRVAVDAYDFAPGMVDKARANLSGRARSVFQGDAMALPRENAPDAAYDAVVSNFGIFLVPDVPAAVREAARVLRPGGLLALTMWEDDGWALNLLVQLAALVSAEASAAVAATKAKIVASGMFDQERMAAAFRETGLVDVAVRRVHTASVVASVTGLVAGYTRLPFAADAFAPVLADGPARTRFLDEAVGVVERLAGHSVPLVANRASFVVTGRRAAAAVRAASPGSRPAEVRYCSEARINFVHAGTLFPISLYRSVPASSSSTVRRGACLAEWPRSTTLSRSLSAHRTA